jgi:hypothetical protein
MTRRKPDVHPELRLIHHLRTPSTVEQIVQNLRI